MRKYGYIGFVALLLLCVAMTLIACQNNGGGETETTSVNTEKIVDTTVESTESTTADFDETDAVTTQDDVTQPVDTQSESESADSDTERDTEEDTVVYMSFSGTDCTMSKEDACTINGAIYLISQAGTYELSGNLSNGQIRVQVDKTEDVTLILNNFTAHCDFSAPLYIVSADEATLQMPEGTVNTFTDSEQYDHGDTKPNACIYSSDDLIIRGKGSLNVTSLWNNGIGCKNDLTLRTGIFTVSAVKNAVKGNGSVTVENGATVTVANGSDGIKTDSMNAGKGFILICEESHVSITCENDALQATQAITVETGCLVQYNSETPVQCDGAVDIADGTVLPMDESNETTVQ